jgi:hypothetical protein
MIRRHNEIRRLTQVFGISTLINAEQLTEKKTHMTATPSLAGRRAKAPTASKWTIIGILLTLVCRSAPAMQLKLSFDELIQKADGVFIGTVVTQSCRFGPNGKMIFTDVQLAVSEWVGGPVAAPPVAADGGTLVLSLAGGQIGEEGVAVSDVPALQTGQTYLIFTKLDGRPYASPIIGASQGLFKVLKDESSGRQFAVTAGDQAITGVGEQDLLLGPPIEGVRAGVARLKQRQGPGPNFHPVAPVAVGGNPAHQARVSAVGRPSAAPPVLLPMYQFVQEIKARLKKAQEAVPPR